MKKTLLIVAAILVSLSSFSQASIADIAYTDGIQYSVSNPVAVVSGGAILVPAADYAGGVNFWDLSNYNGVEVKVTCPTANIGTACNIRFVVVGTSAAQSIVKDFTFDTATKTIKLDFTADGAQSRKLWGMKFNWGTTEGYSVTFDYIKAVNQFTALNDVKADNPDALVNVYNINGSLIRRNVKSSEVVKELKDGLYMIGNKKVLVNNRK